MCMHIYIEYAPMTGMAMVANNKGTICDGRGPCPSI